MTDKPARVRFAPSPTGSMHLGSARTALYDYLLAHRTGGQFILRIEDTDINRYVPGSEDEIMQGLRWLGLQWDEGPDVGGPCGPYRQSERKEIYLEHAQLLVNSGHAYPCFCSKQRLEHLRQEQKKRSQPPHYDGTCRILDPDEAARRVAAGEPHVIRFKTPREGSITIRDVLRGDIVVENQNIDDYVLIKSDGWALYHLAAMVDDHLMGITHVIRGAEWLSTFPLHVHVVRAFGWQEPEWIHLSIFLKPSGKGKMSKRDAQQALDSGYAINIKDIIALGFIPEGVLNWIVLMGWGVAQGDFLTLAEMIDKFDIHHLTPSPAAINFSKLDHFNGSHIRALSIQELSRRIQPFFTRAGYAVDEVRLLQITPLIRERIVTLDDAVKMAGFFFNDKVSPDPEDLIPEGLTASQAADIARQSCLILSSLEIINSQTAEPPMRLLVGKLGLTAGQVFGILRVAVTGQKVSPPLFESMEILGREVVLERVKQAITVLEDCARKSPK